jgi:hypothetical protein
MNAYMDHGCGSNSHLTNGSDKLLFVKKSLSREELQ